MWVFMKRGMVSIVQDSRFKRRGGRLLVRARAREHLVAFMPGHPIESTPEADYPFRIYASARDVADAVERATTAIDYPNFKAAVGPGLYHDALMRVWTAMWTAFRDIRPLFRGGVNGHDPAHVDAEEADQSGRLSR